MRRIIAAILALTALMGLAAVFSPAAFADGDPASDVLVFQSVFNPPDSGASAAGAAELKAVVKAATKAGYPVRVALIGSSADLGTVTDYWEDANGYSQYLGRELSLLFHGAVLVVMPQTDGLYVPVKPSQIPLGDTQAMTGLTSAGSDLAGSATSIVRRLAADNGVKLPSRLTVAAPAATHPSSSTATPLIGFIVGLLVIAGAWAISLRVRPLNRKRAIA